MKRSRRRQGRANARTRRFFSRCWQRGNRHNRRWLLLTTLCASAGLAFITFVPSSCNPGRAGSLASTVGCRQLHEHILLLFITLRLSCVASLRVAGGPQSRRKRMCARRPNQRRNELPTCPLLLTVTGKLGETWFFVQKGWRLTTQGSSAETSRLGERWRSHAIEMETRRECIDHGC